MLDFNTDAIRANIDAFRHFASDRTGKPTDDHSWPSRLIYFFMKSARAAVIKNRNLNVIYDFSDDQLDNLGCVELEKADISECPCAPKSGCTFLKSVEPIPKIIDGRMVSVRIPGLDPRSLSQIEYVPWYKFDIKLKSRISAQTRMPYFTIKKDRNDKSYLFVYNKKLLKSANVSGIFSDPIEVSSFVSCDGHRSNTECNVLDTPFPIQEELKTEVYQLTLNSLYASRQASLPEDETNDDRDNPGTPNVSSRQRRS